ncbi:hypothetical protein GWI33_018093 [Rhynchophorus ferrugineus]|uniref:Attacin C-terminal domain-containing protein n=1 Tax=Rhynchophorus ferrugineus TaxID=354439 RepID=A0A834M5J6_RHYFE|nr:hypothetical protein GWI33_018093 [Rhynchophorus ferrugineus]
MKLISLLLVTVATTALPYAEEKNNGIYEEVIVEDEDGQQFYLLPLGRSKRQTSWQIKNPGIATISHTGGGFAPETYGGNVGYIHKPTGSNLGVGADHTRGSGTNVHASGTYNFLKTKNGALGLTGEYGRNLGGPGGKPNWGVFLGGKWNF